MGHEVKVFEQFPAGHARGSSHGKSRITRTAYPDPIFARIMIEAYPMWEDLELESGTKLLHETGLLYFGDRDREGLHQVVNVLEELGEPHQVLSAVDVKGRYPYFQLRTNEVGVFSVRAGWIHAQLALESIRGIAAKYGAEFVEQRIERVEELEPNFDVVLIAAGAWTPKFVPGIDAKVTLQTFAYVEGSHFGPVWINDAPGYAYGFPTENNNGLFKLGIHEPGLPIDPDQVERAPNTDDVNQIVKFVQERFCTPEPHLTEVTACLYTRVQNDQFRFGKVRDKIWYCSTCSGHGFKLGPWSGKHLVRLALGEARLSDYPSFQIQSGP